VKYVVDGTQPAKFVDQVRVLISEILSMWTMTLIPLTASLVLIKF